MTLLSLLKDFEKYFMAAYLTSLSGWRMACLILLSGSLVIMFLFSMIYLLLCLFFNGSKGLI